MYSLRSLYRMMLLTWLILVLCMGFAVRYNVEEGAGKLFAFLFESPKSLPLPPVTVQEPPMPVPIATPPPEPAKPVIEWVALQKGKQAGKGTLGKPEMSTLKSGEVEVRFACPNTPGNYYDFYPTNIDSLSVDLIGSWGKDIYIDQRIDKGLLKRLQVADHKQWVRVSGIARESTVKLGARVEYNATRKVLRIVFSKLQ